MERQSIDQILRSQPYQASSRPLMDQPPQPTQWLHSGEADKPGSGGDVGAIVPVEKYYSALPSPVPLTPPEDGSTVDGLPPNANPHSSNLNRTMREGTLAMVLAAEAGGGDGRDNGNDEGGKRRGIFSGIKWKRRRKKREEREDRGVVEQIVSRSRKELLLVRTGLGLRFCGLVLSLASFAVMATDRTPGWSGDSFDRHKEYRFCLSVNVIAFAYSAFQACDLSTHLVTGKHLIPHHFRSQFDFIMDQILAYFLLSALSAAASKIDDWRTNWGKDLFTEKASASVSMAFLAFMAFALCSLISGFKLCNGGISGI